MNPEDFQDIRYDREDSGIVTVTLNVPKRKNALSAYTCLELWWAVDAMERDDRAKVMILTGARDPDSADPAHDQRRRIYLGCHGRDAQGRSA